MDIMIWIRTLIQRKEIRIVKGIMLKIKEKIWKQN